MSIYNKISSLCWSRLVQDGERLELCWVLSASSQLRQKRWGIVTRVMLGLVICDCSSPAAHLSRSAPFTSATRQSSMPDFLRSRKGVPAPGDPAGSQPGCTWSSSCSSNALGMWRCSRAATAAPVPKNVFGSLPCSPWDMIDKGKCSDPTYIQQCSGQKPDMVGR
ncbi:hypothetical protein Nmel_018217 [Mimus melanotis]